MKKTLENRASKTTKNSEALNIVEVYELLHVLESLFFRYIPAYRFHRFRFLLSHNLQERLHENYLFLEVAEIDIMSTYVTHFILMQFYLVKFACY